MHDPNLILRQSLLSLLSVVAGIGVLAVLIYWIRAWVRDNEDSAGSTHELLAEYREMNRRGELSDEEYRIIKSRMAPQIVHSAPVTGRGAPKTPLQRGMPIDAISASNSDPEPSDRLEPMDKLEKPDDAARPGPADDGEPE